MRANPLIDRAFLAAAGRARPGRAAADAAHLAFARRVLRGRAVGLEAEPCPPAFRARARGLVVRGRPAIGLARRVYDSLGLALPAARGAPAPRLLRFEQGAAWLDLRIGPPTPGGARRRLEAMGPGPGLALRVRCRRGHGARATLLEPRPDAQGAFRGLLPAGVAALEAELWAGDRVVLRTPRVRVE